MANKLFICDTTHFRCEVCVKIHHESSIPDAAWNHNPRQFICAECFDKKREPVRKLVRMAKAPE
jgi:acetone carboxylase gamma subunit